MKTRREKFLFDASPVTTVKRTKNRQEKPDLEKGNEGKKCFQPVFIMKKQKKRTFSSAQTHIDEAPVFTYMSLSTIREDVHATERTMY